VFHRLLDVGEGQEIVRVDSLDAAPAQVIRDPCGLDLLRERHEIVEVGLVERVGRADRQRDTV
jgi:hypothetical protein